MLEKYLLDEIMEVARIRQQKSDIEKIEKELRRDFPNPSSPDGIDWKAAMKAELEKECSYGETQIPHETFIKQDVEFTVSKTRVKTLAEWINFVKTHGKITSEPILDTKIKDASDMRAALIAADNMFHADSMFLLLDIYSGGARLNGKPNRNLMRDIVEKRWLVKMYIDSNSMVRIEDNYKKS